jgi:site-specific recombinase XerD
MNDIIQFTQHDLDTSALERAHKSGRITDGTFRHYLAAIVLMLASNVNPFNREQLISHADTLPHSGKANLKAALSIMLDDYVDQAKMSTESVEKIQRFLWAVDVIKRTLTIDKPTTRRTPHWISQQHVDTITAAALSHSLRDYTVMGILLGAGLRREELEELTFGALSQIPYHNKLVDVLTVIGKGDKKRVVPISPLLAAHIREWKSVCKATDGERIARKMNKGGKVGKSLSAFGIFTIVRKYGSLVGISDLDPHDCRRSCGRLLYFATKDIVMVQQFLGHENVKTTQGYIGLNINLEIPPEAFPVGRVSGD